MKQIQTIWILIPAVVFLLFTAAQTAHGRQRYPSPADCDAYARHYADRSGGLLRGAAKGAAKGALFGAIIDRRDGAGRGAALGAIAGGAKRAVRKNQTYRNAYSRCMAGQSSW